MVRKWVTWINYFACGIIALLLLGTLYFFLMRQSTFTLGEGAERKLEVPKGAFVRSNQEYETIGAPAIKLAFSPLNVQLPDLRRHLTYYGKNGRPDAIENQPALFFAFSGNKMPTPLFPGERLYLYYDKSQTPHQYVFSYNNAPTPIWMEASAQGNQALVKVFMLGENGQVIREPTAYADFTLPEKEYIRFGGGAAWELGKWRVDGTLLARQKARWVGPDKFLEKHGGEEYKELANKQRIDFGEGQDTYSIYVGMGDCLVWNNDRWQSIKVGEGSLKHTLMCVKKIDERVMNLELWDIDGKGKISLNLVKAAESWLPQNLEQSFKFVGARTRSQFVFEINHERVILRPHDWLVLSDSGWKKLTTPQQIDDYVDRKTIGPLFVFDQGERKEDRQVILGTFFNAARTEMASVELSLQQSSGPAGQRPGGGAGEKKQKTKETNPPSMLNQGGDRQMNRGPQKGQDPVRMNPNSNEHE
jgi:hypothetical protein